MSQQCTGDQSRAEPRPQGGTGAAQGEPGQSPFVAQVTSTFEPLIVDKVCRPVLARLPESIHPNTISLTNHLASWTVAWLAMLSPQLGPVGQPLALVLAGFGMFATMIMDCLDGMQARRTNRCSKLGEMLDHWLDAVHVPLTGVGIAMALQLAPWAVAAVVSTSAMVYHAQLVLYHHRGVFIHPPTSGVDAQVGVSVGFLLTAVLFALVPRQTRWLDLALTGAAVVATLSQSRLCFFYYVRLRRLVWHHLKFVALCAGWSALYLAGALPGVAFVLAITFTSFRISGSYVLYSIIKRPYGGFDWGVALWILIIGAVFFLGGPAAPGASGLVPRAAWPYLPVLPYCALAYMAGRNLVEFLRHFSALRPSRAGVPGGQGDGDESSR